MPGPEGRTGRDELPGKLRLHVQSIRIPLDKLRQKQLCVRFKYGDKNYTTAPTMKVADGSNEHTWSVFSWFLPFLLSLSLE